jgi:hypothetical protein
MEHVHLAASDLANVIEVQPSETCEFLIDGNLPAPGTVVPGEGDQMQVDYSSQLHNVELNRWCHRHGRSWLAGFRYVNLDERFNIHASDFNTGGSDYSIGSWNHLFGGQIGARLAGRRCRLSWDITGKAGLFGNAGGQRTAIADFDNTFALRNTHASATNVAFVADINVSLSWRLSDVWAVRGGYQVMWVEGVALAPDQLDFTDTPLSSTTVDHSGGACWHGAHVGLAACW